MIKKLWPALILAATSAAAAPQVDVKKTDLSKLLKSTLDCRLVRCVEFEPCPCTLPELLPIDTIDDTERPIRLTIPGLPAGIRR